VRIDLVFPKLPPALDGIGDHTALLAAALCETGHNVRVLTAQREATGIDGVAIEQAFSMGRRRGIAKLDAAVSSDPPDWLFVQFNQFSYGRWGLNPYVPIALRKVKRRHPRTRIAVMFHEDFVPITSAKFAVMTTWQRAQLWSLGRTADVVFFSIQPWVEQYRTWFPKTPVYHLPVGSNMPFLGYSREEARTRLRIDSDVFVAGIFGSARGSRLLGLVSRASAALRECTDQFLVLYVGPHGDAVQQAMQGMPVIDAGALPADDVSLHLSAMDMHLAPFVDGVSTRRGSFMAGIQHGLPTVSTTGPLTDRMLAERHGRSFVLSDVGDERGFVKASTELAADPMLRKDIGRDAAEFYRTHFDWSVLAERIGEKLGAQLHSPDGVLSNTMGAK